MKPNRQILFLAGTTALALPAYAQGDIPGSVSANVALTTDYTFRGISQTGEDPALQGGLDYSVDVGPDVAVYLGFWGSNVDQPDPDGSSAQLELNFYGGLSGEVAGVGWNVGGLGYVYPDGDTLNYAEVYGELSYTFGNLVLEPAVSAKVSYSPDYFAESGDSVYVEGAVDLSLPSEFGLGLHVGYQAIEDNDVFGTPDYTDWSVSLSKSIAGVDLAVSYVDTSLSESECFGGTDLCDARAVFTISKSF